MNEYKEEVIQTLLEDLYPTGKEIEVNVYEGDFTCYMEIDTLLNATTTFDDLMINEIEVIFDEVQHQTIIGASSSDIREITLAMVIHFYENQFNIVEPKAGDVFQLSEYGNDRPGDRQAKYFEITEKLDQDIAQINNLQGHYVFLIKAKRLDYSFEPNIPFNNLTSGISGNSQIYEGSFAGRLSGGINEESQRKKDNYDQYDVDSVSKKDVFDMSVNDTDVYGDYY